MARAVGWFWLFWAEGTVCLLNFDGRIFWKPPELPFAVTSFNFNLNFIFILSSCVRAILVYCLRYCTCVGLYRVSLWIFSFSFNSVRLLHWHFILVWCIGHVSGRFGYGGQIFKSGPKLNAIFVAVAKGKVKSQSPEICGNTERRFFSRNIICDNSIRSFYTVIRTCR